MKLYSENKDYKLFNGNMLDMLQVIEKDSIDSIVCDPPYELNFMGKGWDNAGVSFNAETWKQCYEVLKPGGYLLAFGGSRTYHRIAVAIEDAGFEIRDTIMWLYGSGFPKSMNIGLAIDKKTGVESKVVGTGKSGVSSRAYQSEATTTAGGYEIKQAQNEWQGWGTALKPSFEPIIIARKPFKGSLVDNVIKNGVGGLNIDECRVGTEKVGGGTMPDLSYVGQEQKKNGNGHIMSFGQVSNAPRIKCEEHIGRFPANTILTYDETDFEEVCGGFPNTKSTYNKDSKHETEIHRENADTLKYGYKTRIDSSSYNDSGSASRYFYCAKASKKDRDEGCDILNDGLLRRMRPDKDDSNPTGLNKEGRFAPVVRKNTHPTVKPTDLMQYLVRLVTPNGGVVLDPFNGSGSTGKAVMYENKERNKNYKYIGIELTEEYLPIAKARIEYVCNQIENK